MIPYTAIINSIAGTSYYCLYNTPEHVVDVKNQGKLTQLGLSCLRMGAFYTNNFTSVGADLSTLSGEVPEMMRPKSEYSLSKHNDLALSTITRKRVFRLVAYLRPAVCFGTIVPHVTTVGQ